MATSICPNCANEVYSHNYLYVGNHAAMEKGYENSGFKIVGYRFSCRNEVENEDGEVCECDTQWEESQ